MISNFESALLTLHLTAQFKFMQAVVQTNPGNLLATQNFYQKAGFKSLNDNNTLFTDQGYLIQCATKATDRPGIRFRKSSWHIEIELLKDVHTPIQTDTGYLTTDGCGTWIYLDETDEQIEVPTNRSIFGQMAGVNLECIQFDIALSFYQLLGFKIIGGNVNHGYLSLQAMPDFTLIIMKPMMCPHTFINPSFCYFNGGKNEPIIEQIRANQIPIAEEVTCFNEAGIVDNVILSDNGGLGFFVFND